MKFKVLFSSNVMAAFPVDGRLHVVQSPFVLDCRVIFSFVFGIIFTNDARKHCSAF